MHPFGALLRRLIAVPITQSACLTKNQDFGFSEHLRSERQGGPNTRLG